MWFHYLTNHTTQGRKGKGRKRKDWWEERKYEGRKRENWRKKEEKRENNDGERERLF